MKKKRTAAKRKNTKARRTDTQNKAAMIGISGVVSLLVIALLYQSVSLQKKIEANEVRKAQIAEAYAAELKRTEEIEQLQEEMQSDEYYEKIAKEKIGLVKDNEILFKENKEQSAEEKVQILSEFFFCQFCIFDRFFMLLHL